MSEYKEIKTKFDSKCELCEKKILKSTLALYSAEKKKIKCLSHSATVHGDAGKSALEKAKEIEANRKKEVESIPFIGKIIYPFLSPDKEATKWAKGAKGEDRVGEILNEIASDNNFKVLHDRAIPKSKANIDHILVTDKGILIIDAKNYKGKVEIRNDGGWFSKEPDKLIVDGRNRSKLVEGVNWQISRMSEELSRFKIEVDIIGVLGFVDAYWPFFSKPININGVYLNSKGFTYIYNEIIPKNPCDIEKTAAVIERVFKSK